MREGLAELIKLLARIAVDEYLAENTAIPNTLQNALENMPMNKDDDGKEVNATKQA